MFGLALAAALVCGLVAGPAASGDSTRGKLSASAKRKCAKKKTAAKRRKCRRRARQRERLAAQLSPVSGSSAPAYDGHFVTEVHPFTFGQAPAWSPDGKRIVDQERQGGDFQIYSADLDGSNQICLSCGPNDPPAPNQVAHFRPPHGDKILYHSWNGKGITVGAPGFGGVGAEIFVVNPDGSNPVKLTSTGPPGPGGTPAGEGEDNYHAYFSPDGNQIVWTHLDCNFVTQNGRCQMEILLADYVDDASGPHLEDVRQVRPENGHYYETQLWAPDGSGFLFTESVDNSLNLELFFYRVTDGHIERLTNNPAWDEQATFTPDMKKVIFMSTRDHPGAFNTYRALADALGVGADTDWATILPVFEVAFLQPIGPEATDLYELDLETRAVRRLTTSGNDGWIVPEFMWDPNSGRLIWTEARYPDGIRTPLPPDLLTQLVQLAAYLQGGPTVPTDIEGLTPLPIERRTVLGHYEPR